MTDQKKSLKPDQSSCRNCGVKVMPSTLKKNNGMCAPCASSPEKAKIRRANRAPEELRSASEDGNVEIVKRSIDANVDVDARDQYGATALHKASFKGKTEVVKLLMEANADIDARKDDGETALLVASQKDQTEVVKLLIDAGADVNACSHYGSLALYGAGEEGRIELVRLLIDANANVDARNSYGSTALHGASQFGRTEIVDILLKAKANIDAQDQWGFTPLMCASKAGHCEIVKVLLECNADVGAFSEKRHFTALHCAAANGHMEIIKLLINAKADAMARDLGGQTAIDYAKENNHSEVVTFLERAGTEITHRALTQDELIMNFDSKIYFFARKIKKRNEVLTEQALGTANHEECVDAMQAVDKERETILNILLQLDEGSWRNYVNKDFSKACECGVVEMCNFFKRAIDCSDQNIQKIGLILIRSSSNLFDLMVDNESSPAYELKLRKLVR